MLHMKNTFISGLCVFFMLLILLATAGSAFILYRESRQNLFEAKLFLPKLKTYTADIFSADDAAANTERYNLRLLLLKNDNLRSFILYEKESGLLYAYARNPRIIQFPDADTPLRRNIILEKRNFIDAHVVFQQEPHNTIIAEGVFDIFPYERALFLSLILFFFLLFTVLLLFILLLNQRNNNMRTPHSHAGTSFQPDMPSGTNIEHQESPHDTMYHSDSLLCFEEYLNERLDNELHRAASFDQDLVLAFLQCKNMTDRKDYIHLAHHVRNIFHFHDMLFEYQPFTIVIILPNTDMNGGIRDLTKFQKSLYRSELFCNFKISIGLSSRNGRLISYDRIIEEAKAALKRAVKDREASIIGFQSDPGKYRDYIASQNN